MGCTLVAVVCLVHFIVTEVSQCLCVYSVLPVSVSQVLMQYQMTADMWEEKITAWYAEHRGIAR